MPETTLFSWISSDWWGEVAGILLWGTSTARTVGPLLGDVTGETNGTLESDEICDDTALQDSIGTVAFCYPTMPQSFGGWAKSGGIRLDVAIHGPALDWDRGDRAGSFH